ncbi:MAG: ABC transporter permease [Desulfovibrio sp.]|jgi:putative ABC transport system permease protein|nr:ABC transporter permease [Desulfovibrio sp.]
MADKAFTPHRLALQNLRRKPYRNLGLAALVGIFSAVLFGGSILNSQLGKGLESLSERLGADVLIVPYGYKRVATAALLRGEPSTYYMRKEVLDSIRALPGIAALTPQFFLASLSDSCCSEHVQIMGFDPESDFLIRPWMQNIIAQLGDDEIVVGSKIITSVGDRLFFFGKTYRVAAKMAPTGMGLDTSVFMPLETLYTLIRGNPYLPKLLENPHFLQKLDPPEAYISSVAVKVNPEASPRAVGNAIMLACAAEYNLDQVVAENIVAETARRLHGLSASVYWVATGIWLLAVLVISLVFSVSASERKHEMSLYRLLGARRSWVAKLLRWEAFFICAGGALAGILAASCVIFPFSTLIFDSLKLPHLAISGGSIAGHALLTLAIASISGPLACANTVWSLTRFDVYSSLREAE